MGLKGFACFFRVLDSCVLSEKRQGKLLLKPKKVLSGLLHFLGAGEVTLSREQ
jgi:hypothetical protein